MGHTGMESAVFLRRNIDSGEKSMNYEATLVLLVKYLAPRQMPSHFCHICHFVSAITPLFLFGLRLQTA